MARPRVALAAGLLAAIAGPRLALAANGASPRTQPVFKNAACVTVVDKAVDARLTLDVAIPYEDTELTPDEPEGSRTFQFFALCHDHDEAVYPPTWIEQADVDAALATGVLEEPPDPADLLAGHPEWDVGHDGAAGSCVQPIVAAADRIPITCEGVSGGVQWDASAAPPGNYVVRGYTYQPAINVWTPRAGLVRLVDGDEAALGPYAALVSPRGEAMVYADAGYRIVGCMGGIAGTEVRVQWARVNEDVATDAAWHDIGEPLDAAAADIDVAFFPPPEAVNQGLFFRAIATDPMGRSWTAYAHGTALVFEGDGPSDCPQVHPGPDFCGDFPEPEPIECEPLDPSGDTGETGDGGSGSTAADDGGGEDDSTAAAGDGDGNGGCACRSRGAPAPAVLSIVLLACARRRARGARHCARG